VAELRQLARSAQFQQQLAAFSGALQTGQLDLSQFGLRAEVRRGPQRGRGGGPARGVCLAGGQRGVLQQAPRRAAGSPLLPSPPPPHTHTQQGFSVTDFLHALEELVERERRQEGGAQQ
jgi:hypothetical protein